MEAAAISNLPVSAAPEVPVGAPAYASDAIGATGPQAKARNAAADANAGPSGFAQTIEQVLARTVGENPATPPAKGNATPPVRNGSAPAAAEPKDASVQAPPAAADLTTLANLNIASAANVNGSKEPATVTPVSESPSQAANVAAADTQESVQNVAASASPATVVFANIVSGAAAQIEEQESAQQTDAQAGAKEVASASAASAQTAIASALNASSQAVQLQVPSKAEAGSSSTTAPASEKMTSVQINSDFASPASGQPLSDVFKQLEQVESPGTASSVTVTSTLANAPAEQQHPTAQSVQSSTATTSLAVAEIKTLESNEKNATWRNPLPQVEVSKTATSSVAISPANGKQSETPGNASNRGDESSTSSEELKNGRTSTPNATSGSSPNETLQGQAGLPFSQVIGPASADKAESVATSSAATATVAAPTPQVQPANPPLAVAQPAAPPAAPSTNPSVVSGDHTAIHVANDTQLMQTATHSEIRIAMQTDKFGSIELHARVMGDEIGATIAVEKRDAHAALAAELPALQQALSEKQLRVDQVSLLHASLGSTAGDAGANAQQRERGQVQRSALPGYQVSAENDGMANISWMTPEQMGVFDSQGRLSVLA
jgi:Flagellar hook-length control protein FliK